MITFVHVVWCFLLSQQCCLSICALPLSSNLTMTVSVPFGRTAVLRFDGILDYLSTQNASIPRNRCRIVNLNSEPSFSKVGWVSPNNFSCFSSNTIYTHFGFESPNEDTAKFRLSFFTPTDFFEYTVYVVLNIQERGIQNLVQKGLPLRVTEKSGVSTPVTRNAVKLGGDDFPDSCHIHIVKHPVFPRFGRFTEEEDQLTCAQFFAGEIVYQLTADVFSSHDIVVLKVETLDSDSRPNYEYFSMPIQIEHSQENSPPEIAFVAQLLVEAQNFVMKTITRDALLAEDRESSSESLIYHVTQAPDISQGFLVRLDSPIHPVESFTQRDVDMMKIAFRPPMKGSDTDLLLEIILEIIDPEGLTSEPVPLMIMVHPTSYFAPFVVLNLGLTMYEGDAATLWHNKNLAVADEDNYSDISLRIVSGLAHGRLLKHQDSVKQFVPADLEIGSLVYEHDGSDTTADSIVLEMDDGKHQVEFLVAITILPVDDKPPVLLANTGILVNKPQEVVKITSKILRAKDMDSQNYLISYKLNSAFSSRYGYLFLDRNDTNSFGNDESISTWTQADIDNGHLYYQHQGEEFQVSTTWYSLDFTLQDNNDPPNLSPYLHPLTVTFIPQDTNPPHSSSAASMRLHVNSSEVAIIGNGILHFIDAFTSDRDLLLIVRALPRFGALMWANGRQEERIPDAFPQSVLAYGEIVYQAPVLPSTSDAAAAILVAKDELVDLFVVDVKDQQGNILQNQTLEIFIEAPRARKPRYSHKPPAVVSRVVLIKEGEMASISDDYLLISDPDTDLSAITITVDKAPSMGKLWLNNKSLTVQDHFSADVIRAGQLVYKNIKSPHFEDVMRFNLSDDSPEPVTAELHVRIIPAQTPLQEKQNKLGLSKLGLVFTVTEDSDYVLTRSSLLGSADIGSYPPRELLFQLEIPPRNGLLLLNGTETMKFSWKDVEQEMVVYKPVPKSDDKTPDDNAVFDDDISFKISTTTDEWVLNDKIIDHLDIQILLTPKNSITVVGKSFLVPEGESGVLTQEHLVVPPQGQSINCTLVSPPQFGRLIDFIHNTTVKSFSNTDIIQHRIYYQQNVNRDVEPRADSIRLSCMGTWVELPVIIAATNDEPPVIFSSNIAINAGEKVPFGSFISLFDSDDPEDNVTVDIISFPRHGLIVFDFAEEDPNAIQIEPTLRPIRNFSAQQLILPGKILYQHDGSHFHLDEFTLRATDGVYSVEKVVEITIRTGDHDEEPADDDPSYGLMEIISSPVELVGAAVETRFYNASSLTGYKFLASKENVTVTTPPPIVPTGMPNITINSLTGPLVLLPNKHLGVFLTSELINISRDNSSAKKELLIEIVRRPRFGIFVDLHHPERNVNVFTEDSLSRMDIAYALQMEHEHATEDSFTFQAVNEFGNRSGIIKGLFRWSWISFVAEKYETNEVMGMVKIGVRRRGWLQKRDFVAIKARDLTATMGSDYKEDFALQAEFQPGQSETFVEIRVMKDDKYEDKEYFQLVLEEPQIANVQKPFVATITITDRDDSSMIYIPQPSYFVKESAGIFNLTLMRSGRDASQLLSVICFTTDGTATGTVSRSQQLFRPDYVSRLNIHSSVVRFKPNETTAICPVVIVDDNAAEDEEHFLVGIRALGHARIGVYEQTEIVIIRDPNDEPTISFANSEYHTTIFDPYLDIQLDRKGGDMNQPSEVEVVAESGKRVDMVYFAPGETAHTLTVKNVASFGNSSDMFIRLFLNSSFPHHPAAPNNFATIFVKKHINYTILSSMNGGMNANEIVLLGNYDTAANVRSPEARYECLDCVGKVTTNPPLTELESARYGFLQKPVSDFRAQPEKDLNLSKLIRLYPIRIGTTEEAEAVRKEGLLDAISEDVPVVRGAVRTKQREPVPRTFSNISTISFAKTHYEIVEPLTFRRMHWISLQISRDGNLARSDTVRVITKDGTAKAGQDYEAVDTVVNFAVNRTAEILQIRIIFDDIKEAGETFTVHIYPLRRTLANVRSKAMATVTIQEQAGGNLRFPGPPLVVNLDSYDRPIAGGWVGIGQPAICITTCNPRHPDYSRTKIVCEMESIDDKQTVFDWRISHPLENSDVLEPLQHVRGSAWFADIYGPVLDSIYFANGSIIQCLARAINQRGHGGFESSSEIVTAVSLGNQCPSSKTVHVDPFQAKISHTKDKDVKVTVMIPHRIGLIPLISTSPITDLHLVLGLEGIRTVEHRCSNMISSNELRTSNGFLRRHSSKQELPLNEDLRGNRTVEFYRNLNLQNCAWTFETTFTVSEVTNICGGKLLSDNSIQMSSKREISIELPLYVSYAYFTNSVGQPWKRFDQSTTMRIVFLYDSIMTWGATEATPTASRPIRNDENAFGADLKILQAKVVDDRSHINVRFKTIPKFRGKFVTHDLKNNGVSKVVFTTLPTVDFELKLLRTQENNPHPQQLWRFRTLRGQKINYNGSYNVTLQPCEFTSESYSSCAMRSPVTFVVDVTESA